MTAPDGKPGCRNCGHENVNRPRGLCWTCYHAPGVRERFPSTSKYARHGVNNTRDVGLPCRKPSAAPPGSPERIADYERRAKRGEQLFHPDDANVPD